MTPRTIHIGSSFAIVMGAYWLYALVAVPLIEPPAGPVVVVEGSDTTTTTPSALSPAKELAPLFPPDAWELRDPKIIDTDQAKVLLQKYKNLPNNWVEFTPLTIVFFSSDGGFDPVEKIRRAVVLEVPEGANLRFDRPLDISKGGIGRLIEGKLRGKVTIRSNGKRPDHQDDLLVVTHDVDISEQRIFTPNEVDFRWGGHSGRGRQLEIKLLPRLGPRLAQLEGPNVGGIEQITLEHVDRLHMELGSTSEPQSNKGPSGAAPMLGSLGGQAAPVDVSCKGPFHFNLIEQVATFRDQVDVLRVHPSGPSDRMSCEKLSIFFMRPIPSAAAVPAKQTAPGFDLQPERLEAQGTPATMTAPMDKLQARGEWLKYNLASGQMFLEGSQEVVLQKDSSEIHARSVKFDPGPQGRMGQMLAVGPGWLRGEMANRPGQQLEASWNEKLEVRPQDQSQVISLTGGAELRFQAMGQLDAREIHFWMHESPPTAPGQNKLQPDRLLAEGSVVGSSPQFSSKVERLEVWFTAAPVGNATLGVSPVGSAVPGVVSGVPGVSSPTISAVPVAARVAAQGEPNRPDVRPAILQDPARSGRQSHMEITGRLLQARVLLHDQEHGELTEVTVVDNVRLQETQTAQPNDQPLLVTGQWLHATDAGGPKAKVTVKGEPAHMEGRGMSLTGPNIQIDRTANSVVMEGPGRMERFVDRDLEGRPLARPGLLRIDWQKAMNFDGRKAQFRDSVTVGSGTQLLQTAWLDVHFQQAISFAETKQQQSPQVETLNCGGGVFIENRTLEAGQQVSYERMQMQDLNVNNINGDINASGPGWLVSVRRGGNVGFAMPGGTMAGGRPAGIGTNAQPVGFNPAKPAGDANALKCLHLKFNKSITGNVKRKDLAFHGQVRTAYAPATSWTTTLESDDPAQLGDPAFVLHCDDMAVNDMSPVSGNGANNIELTATNNVIAEGTDFTARANRLSFAQAKQLLVLVGDGRTDAELFKQEGVGRQASRFAAQQIDCFFKDNRINQVIVDGVRSLDLNQLQGASFLPGGKK